MFQQGNFARLAVQLEQFLGGFFGRGAGGVDRVALGLILQLRGIRRAMVVGVGMVSRVQVVMQLGGGLANIAFGPDGGRFGGVAQIASRVAGVLEDSRSRRSRRRA